MNDVQIAWNKVLGADEARNAAARRVDELAVAAHRLELVAAVEADDELAEVELSIEWQSDRATYWEACSLIGWSIEGDDIAVDDVPLLWSAAVARELFGVDEHADTGRLTRTQILAWKLAPR